MDYVGALVVVLGCKSFYIDEHDAGRFISDM